MTHLSYSGTTSWIAPAAGVLKKSTGLGHTGVPALSSKSPRSHPPMKSYQVLPLLIMLALAPLSALLRAVPSEPPVKPNIIYILLDDAGIGDFSAYGCKYGVTPNIDRLATEGMKFTRAYSGSAVCAPSRMVLMTGQHTGHILRRANQSKIGLLALPAGQTTVARMLQNAGYATGGFGKWGLGNP